LHIIVDYGLGNLESISRSCERVGIETMISGSKEDIISADTLILPGVGAFRDAISLLKAKELIPLINQHVEKGKYLLGICLGMQLLYEKSYENGEYEGLGYIKGSVTKLSDKLKVPHMGWNDLTFNTNDHILKYINENDYVYFVHSYYINSSNKELIASTNYGELIPAIVKMDNIYGMQFHPEKSSDVGLNILKAYGEIIK